jgi:hypothetical protein
MEIKKNNIAIIFPVLKHINILSFGYFSLDFFLNKLKKQNEQFINLSFNIKRTIHHPEHHVFLHQYITINIVYLITWNKLTSTIEKAIFDHIVCSSTIYDEHDIFIMKNIVLFIDSIVNSFNVLLSICYSFIKKYLSFNFIKNNSHLKCIQERETNDVKTLELQHYFHNEIYSHLLFVKGFMFGGIKSLLQQKVSIFNFWLIKDFI